MHSVCHPEGGTTEGSFFPPDVLITPNYAFKTDILYMTRIQKERFPDPVEYEKMKNAYILKKEMLTNAKSGLKVMHPLPRVNEISEDVDDAEHAHYFQQAHYGIPTRMAIIALLLGVLE